MVKWGRSRGNLQLREQVLQIIIIIIHEVIKKLNKPYGGDEELKTNPYFTATKEESVISRV
jgi:hypothetical protein